MIVKMLMFFIVLIVVLVPVGVFTPVVLNGVPLIADPGFSSRMGSYLTSNIAQTSTTHPFPELRTRTFDVEKKDLFQKLLLVIKDLGWKIKDRDQSLEPGDQLKVVVTSGLWGFQDDIVIRLEHTGSNQSLMHLDSRSRLGKADFGANLAHILRLYEQLGVKMGENR